jgi:hypothetical protein
VFSRRVLFALLALGVAIATATSSPTDGSKPRPRAPGSPAAVYSEGAKTAPSAVSAPLRPLAARFLRALLRYEVGELSRPRVLRHLATAGFAKDLLSHPPPAAGAAPLGARLSRLVIHPFPDTPPRALVSALALRAGDPEQLAFLFESQRGRWRVVAPAE